MSRKPFMKDPETGKHRQANVEGLYKHYPGTCTMRYIQSGTSTGFDPRKTATKTRLYPSLHGWVAVCYETDGLITFYVQLDKDRAAWQRIEWSRHFDENWDDTSVQAAIDNFLWVAACEEAGKILPRE